MEEMPFEVKLVSSEAVKPSIPTPSNLKNFTLSYVDQILPIIPPFLTSGLVFYNTKSTKTKALDHIARLKLSLSKALVQFYPLAGRIRQSTITCNDKGIPLFITEANCTLSNAIVNLAYNLDFGRMFLPSRESLGIVDAKTFGNVVHLAIQINIFTCGGISIGWYDIHKLMDGISSATFFKYWATLSADKNYNNLVMPDFFSTVTAFPPSPKVDILEFQSDFEDSAYHIVVKSFIFRNKAIRCLKDRAATKEVPNPSSFTVLAAFIWEQLHARGQSDTVMQVTIDMRSCISPPLSKGSIGNLINTAVARADKCARFPKLTDSIQAAVAQMKDQIKGYSGEKGVKKLRENWNKVSTILHDYKERAYKVVSWHKLGFTDLDFGFGKPLWMVPTDGIITAAHKNLIIFNNYVDKLDGGGIQAWIFLENKDMKMLECNHQFLAVASPFSCKNLL